MLSTRIGVKPVLVTGLSLMVAGMLWYTQISADGSYAVDLLPGFVAVGIGLPFSYIPLTIAALAGVEDDDAGLASGLLTTSQQVGGAIGVAILSTVAFTHARTLAEQGTDPKRGPDERILVGLLGRSRNLGSGARLRDRAHPRRGNRRARTGRDAGRPS